VTLWLAVKTSKSALKFRGLFWIKLVFACVKGIELNGCKAVFREAVVRIGLWIHRDIAASHQSEQKRPQVPGGAFESDIDRVSLRGRRQ